MSSISSAVSADSVSGSSEPGCEPLPSVSETPSARLSSRSIGRQLRYSQMSLISDLPMLRDLVESTLSPAASPASPSLTPASKPGDRTTAISGRACAESLNGRDLLGSLAKMLLASSRWNSIACSLIWRVSATPRGRLLFRLVPSMRRTDGIESGSLLATPTATANQTCPSMQKWRSCRALWPTPRAADGEKGIRTPEGAAKERLRRKNGEDLPSAVGGTLNPRWVEWMMGYPDGWTDLGPLAIPSSRKSSKRSAAPS